MTSTSKKEISPLSLEHQEYLESLWGQLCLKEDIRFAEYSFANNFLFRKRHGYAVVNTTPPFLVSTNPSPGGLINSYFIPTCSPKYFTKELLTVFKEVIAPSSTIHLFPIPEQWLPLLEQNLQSIYSCRGQTDYIFGVEKIETLKGRSLSSRRNLLHQLEGEHRLESRELTKETKQDAIAVLERWQKESSVPKEENDYYPCLEALELMDRLKLSGRIAYADGEPIGFTIGEMLTPQTSLLHIAKPLHSVKGAAVFLYQDFASHLPDSVEWINFEQDLGIPSLRQAKSAYDPDLLLTKWHVKIRVD